MIQNVIIGKPLCDPRFLIAYDIKDWEENERKQTLITDERFLPAIMKAAGLVPSIGEVRRNKPEFMVSLEKPDCLWVKWGKHFLYIIVGC